MTEKERECRKYKAALVSLTKSIGAFCHNLDKVMTEPEGRKRGEQIADLTNKLTMINDTTMLFTLKYSWNKINKIKGLIK